MSKTIEQMKSHRRELDRKIKAAQRAEAKRQREELAAAKLALGERLAERFGADSVDSVNVLLEQVVSGNLPPAMADSGGEVSDGHDHWD